MINMDHLPLPLDRTIEKIDIPFLYGANWDEGDFLQYPERAGWTLEQRPGVYAFTYHGREVTDNNAIAAFLQTWLYFGLLHKITGGHVDVENFQRLSNSGEIYLSSRSLGAIMISWSSSRRDSLQEVSDAEAVAWRDNLCDCLGRARDVVGRTLTSIVPGPSDPLSLVCLSVATLCEYLCHALGSVCFTRGIKLPPRNVWRLSKHSDCGQPILELMRERGWCPNKLSYFEREVSRSIGKLWYFANFKPPMFGQSHAHCTDETCALLQIDLTKYKTVHSWCDVESSKVCDFLGPNYEKLAHIVRHGTFALVAVETSPMGEVTVHVRKGSPATEFVAISHVWADGNGNLEYNTLPKCTLRDIQWCVDDLPNADGTPRRPGTPFWMDTLCLPRYPLELRRKAIVSLSEPFKHATETLVIDTYLRSMPAAHMSTAELLARVMTSNWVQRLWTFSEGRFARNVWFQFADQAVHLHDEVENWRRNISPLQVTPSSDVDFALAETFQAIKILPNDATIQDLTDIAVLRSALAPRSTSWAPDEALCLGSILDFDMNSIVEAAENDKMKVIWSMMANISVGFLFSHASRKLHHAGFRWAPESFMGDALVKDWDGHGPVKSQPAQSTTRGLLVKVPALFFQIPSNAEAELGSKQWFFDQFHADLPELQSFNLLLQDKKGLWYSCMFKDEWHQHSAPVDTSQDMTAILLDGPLTNRLGEKPASLMSDFDSGIARGGVLVTYSQNRVADQPLQVKAHRHLSIQFVSRAEQKLISSLKECSDSIYGGAGNPSTVPVEAVSDEALASHVNSHIQRTGLVTAVRDTHFYQSPDYTDEHAKGICLQFCLPYVRFFARIGRYHRLEEVDDEPVEFCVD